MPRRLSGSIARLLGVAALVLGAVVLGPLRPALAGGGFGVSDLTIVPGQISRTLISISDQAWTGGDTVDIDISTTGVDLSPVVRSTAGNACALLTSGGHVYACTASPAAPNAGFYLQWYPPSEAMHLRGQYDATFPIRVTDTTTGDTASGTAVVKPLADQKLWGPYVANTDDGLYFSTDDNNGPSVADGVKIVISIAGPFSVPGLPSNCTLAGQRITCDLGTVDGPAHGHATLSIPLGPDTGVITVTATLSSDYPDPNLSDNTGVNGPINLFGAPLPPGTGSTPSAGSQPAGGGHAGGNVNAPPTTTASASASPADVPAPTTSGSPLAAVVAAPSGSVVVRFDPPASSHSLLLWLTTAGIALAGGAAAGALVSRRRRLRAGSDADSTPTGEDGVRLPTP